MEYFTPIVNRLLGRGQEEQDAGYDSPNVDAAAGDKGEATNQDNPNDAASTEGLGGVVLPRVSMQDQDRRESSDFNQQEQDTICQVRRESSEFDQQEQDTMQGMLKLLLANHETLQKKLDDQHKDLTSLRNVS